MTSKYNDVDAWRWNKMLVVHLPCPQPIAVCYHQSPCLKSHGKTMGNGLRKNEKLSVSLSASCFGICPDSLHSILRLFPPLVFSALSFLFPLYSARILFFSSPFLSADSFSEWETLQSCCCALGLTRSELSISFNQRIDGLAITAGQDFTTVSSWLGKKASCDGNGAPIVGAALSPCVC